MQARDSSNYAGIDISAYQAGLNFATVKAAGIQIVYIKATEGTGYTNPYLQYQYNQAKANGLKVGFYHFYSPSKDAEQQAIYFNNAISVYEYDCFPVLDVESYDDSGKDTFSAKIHACLNEIAYLTQHKPVIYTYTSFINSYLTASYVNMYPLWVADYNSSGAPGNNSIWNSWVGYQYSSSGNIGGVTIDMDAFTVDILIEGEAAMLTKTTVQLNGNTIGTGYLIDDRNQIPVGLLIAKLAEVGIQLGVTWDDTNKICNIIYPVK
jgi:Lyzozyme M1 (1,4-beta-N-acetylmuramidase)